MLRMSEEMLKIMHQHHLSTGNQKYSLLNKSQAKCLDNQGDDDLLKEMSNFMEPREIISIFSMDRRLTPNGYHSNHRENAINSVQLSTLSTNPKKKEVPDKHKFDTDSDNADNVERMKADEREALIEDNSVIYDDEALHDDESAGAGPNEAMYVNVDPIPKSLMLTFEEAIQRQKEILDKSSKVNLYVMPVWDSRKHTKHKFYKGDDVQKDETSKIFAALSPAFDYDLKRIPDIAENPVIVKGKLKPSKVVMGKLKSSMSLTCAIISICNYDSQFEKSTIGSLIFPNKDDCPIYNASGSYGIKVRFNGAQRLIKIDDYLPVDSASSPLLANSK